jgi:hypothetical protein
MSSIEEAKVMIEGKLIFKLRESVSDLILEVTAVNFSLALS